MEELQSAIKYVIIIVSTVCAMVLGDYMGYKIGRVKLVWSGVVVALLAIIVFAVYAAITLLS
jgi:hypothetical protein